MLLRYSTFHFWGCLPMEVVFVWRIYKIWVDHISLSLQFEYGPISGCWDNPLFNILRLSSIGGCLHLTDLYNIVWSHKLKFKIWVGSNKWLLRYSTFNIFRSSSIRGCLLLKDLHNMVCSYMFKFQIWVWSYKRLLRYSTLNILMSSSIGGCLPL